VSIIMCFIKYVCRVDLRLSEDKLMLGDGAVHGEVAYCFDEDVIGMPRSASDAMVSGRANISNHTTIEGRDLEKGSDDVVAPEVGQSSKHQDSKID
jgi:Amt family ammonium transporter